MQIDLSRWQNLGDQLREVTALRRGLNEALFEIEGRVLVARGAHDRLVSRRPRQFTGGGRIARPGGNWPADAQVRDPAHYGTPLPLDAADFDQAERESAEQLAILEDEQARLQARLAVHVARFNSLDSIRRAVLAWAEAAGVSLPGGDTRAVVIPPASPAGTRTFDLEAASSGSAGPGLAAAGPVDDLASGRRSAGFFAFLGGNR
jgi:hypothetical protein